LATVELTKGLDSGHSLSIRFDVRNVVEGIEQPFEDDFEGEEPAASEEKDDGNVDYESDHIYPIEVEVRSADGKKLILDCEVNAALDENPLMVTNASISDPNVKASSDQGQIPYNGPQYEQLDDGLREAMDAYVNKLVQGDVVQFISDYAFSKESTQYGVWLENVKSVIKP
jgi:hypothetical protein